MALPLLATELVVDSEDSVALPLLAKGLVVGPCHGAALGAAVGGREDGATLLGATVGDNADRSVSSASQ